MAEEVASLYVTVGADTSGLQKGLADTQAGMKQTAAGADGLGTSIGGVDKAAASAANGGMVKFAASAVSTATGMLAGAAAAGAMIDKVNSIGVASLRARAGLDSLTSGRADEYITKMTNATRGLVDHT